MKSKTISTDAPDESRWHKVYLGIVVYLVMLIILLWTFSRVFSR